MWKDDRSAAQEDTALAPPITAARGLYLEVTLVNGQNYSILIPEGHVLDQELELFLNREGRYGAEWIPLHKAGRELYVRYEQIVLVSPKP